MVVAWCVCGGGGGEKVLFCLRRLLAKRLLGVCCLR